VTRRRVQRQRRRTERELDEAFAAYERGELGLALRIGRRAQQAGSMNPRVQLDFAELAVLCGEVREAEEVLRAAVAATPVFTAGHVALAELLWRAGRRRAALHALERAVGMAAGDAGLAAKLAQWRVEAPEAVDEVAGGEAGGGVGVAVAPEFARTRRWAAPELADQFVEHGAVRLAEFLAAQEIARLHADYAAEVEAFDREERWAGAPAEVRGRYWRELPGWLVEVREAGYALAAAVAAELRARLGHEDGVAERAKGRPGPWPAAAVPATWAGWRGREVQFASPRPFVRMVWVAAGAGLVGPERVDRRAFPLRLAVDLGDGEVGGGDGGGGASLVLTDVRPGRKVHERGCPSRCGDALLFAARERLDRVGGVLGLQAVRWRVVGGARGCPSRCGDALLFAARERLDRVGGVLGLQAVRWRVVGGARGRWVLDVPFDDG